MNCYYSFDTKIVELEFRNNQELIEKQTIPRSTILDAAKYLNTNIVIKQDESKVLKRKIGLAYALTMGSSFFYKDNWFDLFPSYFDFWIISITGHHGYKFKARYDEIHSIQDIKNLIVDDMYINKFEFFGDYNLNELYFSYDAEGKKRVKDFYNAKDFVSELDSQGVVKEIYLIEKKVYNIYVIRKHDFPIDIFNCICSFMDTELLLKASQVCNNWRLVISEMESRLEQISISENERGIKNSKLIGKT